MLALSWRFLDVSRLANHQAGLYRRNVEDNVVNSKKHSIMQIQNGSREAALANEVGPTSFTDNGYPNSGIYMK